MLCAMDPILSEIDKALARKGLSDAAASKLAVGHPSLLKNFRMERAGDKRYNLTALQKLAQVLDLELYFGPRRTPDPEPPTIALDGDEFSAIPKLAVAADAGAGRINDDAPEVVGKLAFRRDWLRRIGVRPDKAMLITINGDSMAPGLCSGALALVDTARCDFSNRTVFAFTDIDGSLRVKRLYRGSETSVVLVSDNPDFAPEVRSRAELTRVKLLGRVVWSGQQVA